MTIAPIVSHNNVEVAPIGLVNMLNPGGAVLSAEYDPTIRQWHANAKQRSSDASSSMASRQNGDGAWPQVALTVRLEVKGAGEFVAFCSRQPLSCKVMDRDVQFAYDAGVGRLSLHLPRGGPLERLLTFVL